MNQPNRKWRQVKDPTVEGESIISTIAFKLFGIVGVFGTMVLTAKLFPDAPGYKFAVAAVVGAILSVLAYDGFERVRGEPGLVDFRLRAHRFLAIGMGLALALSVALLVGEIRGEKSAAVNREAAQKDRDAYYEKLRSPDVQRGMQAMEQIQAMRERRASTRPATAPSAP